MQLMSKTDLKIAAVQRAIAEIDDFGSETTAAEAEQSRQRLRRFLATMTEDL